MNFGLSARWVVDDGGRGRGYPLKLPLVRPGVMLRGLLVQAARLKPTGVTGAMAVTFRECRADICSSLPDRERCIRDDGRRGDAR